jgi:DNA-binding IclR family transcriptional regulator
MSENDVYESLDLSKKEGANENSSMLKGIIILEALSAQTAPCSLAQLMQITGIPKASLYRSLAIFEDAGFVSREPGSKSYIPGDRLAQLGLATLTHDSIAAIRHTILRQLVAELGETCNLAILKKGELYYLNRVEANWPLRLNLPTGTSIPAHCSASGKLLLAYKPADERNKILENLPLEKFTHRTITDRNLLASELDRIVSTGYSIDNEEYVVGVACVAVPVKNMKNEVVAAIAVHAATARLPLTQALAHIPQLINAANSISQTLT